MNRPLKTILMAACTALPLFALSAHAQTTRASCEADAKAQNLTGSDRASFMKVCLPEGMKDMDEAKPAKATKTSAKKTNAKSKNKAKSKTKAKAKTTAKVDAPKS
jgi:hypothetical protein